jgi:hypothetical protein
LVLSFAPAGLVNHRARQPSDKSLGYFRVSLADKTAGDFRSLNCRDAPAVAFAEVLPFIHGNGII